MQFYTDKVSQIWEAEKKSKMYNNTWKLKLVEINDVIYLIIIYLFI